MVLLCRCEFFHSFFMLFCLWVFLYLHFSVLLVYCLFILIFVFLGFYLTEGKNIRLGDVGGSSIYLLISSVN